MGRRGPHSSAALAIVGAVDVAQRIESPAPPIGMPDSQRAVWALTVGSLDADWFRPEQLPLLTQYCRHVEASNIIDRQIGDLLSEPPPQGAKGHYFHVASYNKLLRLQQRETRAIATLSTKMRLSQLSSYDKSKKKPPVDKCPWDVG